MWLLSSTFNTKFIYGTFNTAVLQESGGFDTTAFVLLF